MSRGDVPVLWQRTASGVNDCKIFIVDPFGTTRDYDEALLRSIRSSLPKAKLLTTRFNDRREVESPLGEGFFLRGARTMQTSFPAIPLKLLKAFGALEYFFDVVRLVRLARRENAVLHWQWLPFPIIAVPLLRILRVPRPLLLTAHDVMHHHADRRERLSMGDRWKYRFATAIVVHGGSIRNELASLEPTTKSKTTVIPHGLNFEDRPDVDRVRARVAQGLPENGTLVGFVGLLRPHKGLGDLIPAWQRVPEQRHDQRAYLVVTGEWRAEEWRKSAKDEEALVNRALNSDPSIIFRPGYVPEAAFLEILNAMDALVLPYRYASQSGIALSALRFGIPMIVSSEGALAELLPDQLRQWVIDTSDPLDLTRALNQFLALDEDRRCEIREILKDVAHNYSWKNIATRYQELYSTLEP